MVTETSEDVFGLEYLRNHHSSDHDNFLLFYLSVILGF